MPKKALNITNGDAFNEHFLSERGGAAVPFCESMMDGDTVADIYSAEFIQLRAAALGVDAATYRSKMQAYDALNENEYSPLILWFGKDTFCQMNLLTLLAYLEQIGYRGGIVLNYIDDETFEVLEADIAVELGAYRRLYEDILISHLMPREVGVLSLRAIELYFDYRSPNGALAEAVRANSDMDPVELICLLLENSKEYGLSDTQAQKLISGSL